MRDSIKRYANPKIKRCLGCPNYNNVFLLPHGNKSIHQKTHPNLSSRFPEKGFIDTDGPFDLTKRPLFTLGQQSSGADSRRGFLIIFWSHKGRFPEVSSWNCGRGQHISRVFHSLRSTKHWFHLIPFPHQC